MVPDEYRHLIGFLGERFEAIDRRFEAIDRRFEVMDQRFEAIDGRFDAIDRRLETMDRRFDGVDHRFALVDARFDRLERGFDAWRAEVGEQFRAVFGHFDEVYRRLEGLDQEHVAITQALRRIEGA